MSSTAYAEVTRKLRDAGYDHAFDGAAIDMHGLMIVPAAPCGQSLVDTARRNIRQYLSKASFATQADRQSAGQCVDVLEESLASFEAAVIERDRLLALINAPENDAFLRGTHIEAVHQVERWGTAHDRAKRPADWFWLVGYLAGKALHAVSSGDVEKAKHHCISTAAALYNWHCAIAGKDVRMAPGSSDIAAVVDAAFPGEATIGGAP